MIGVAGMVHAGRLHRTNLYIVSRNTFELPIIRPGWAGMARFKNPGGEHTIASESP